MAKARTNFDSVIGRTRSMLSLYAFMLKLIARQEAQKAWSAAQADLARQHAADLVRAALVLTVSAMDAYFTNKFLEKLVPYIRKHGVSPDLEALLKEAGIGVGDAINLFVKSDRALRKIRTLVDEHLENKTTQQWDIIDGLFKCYGLPGLTSHGQGKTKKKKIRDRIGNAVSRRHKIVHGGDLNDHGKLRELPPVWTVNRVADIEHLVHACDEIIDAALK